METSYKILGGDGREYGPATLEQMLGWIRDGRVNGATQVWRSDQSAWVTARQLPELQLPAAPPVVAPPVGAPFSFDRQHLVSRMRSGGSWFYWIAGLSLINSISAFSGGGWGFIVGLGITHLVDRIATGRPVALAMNAMIAVIFILLGVFANRGQLWAFIIGMVLYAFDGLIYAKAEHWLAAAFHVFVLIGLFSGFRAARRLRMIA